MQKEKLKTYLFSVLRAETLKYQLEQSSARLQKQSSLLGHTNDIPEPIETKSERIDLEGIGCVLLIVLIIVGLLAFWVEKYIDITYTHVLGTTLLLSLGVCAFVNYRAGIKADEENYHNNEDYEEKLINEEKRLVNEQQIKDKLQADIKEVEDRIRRISKYLEDIYNYNIIYHSYRNIIAIASFYQYFDSGRCEDLIGANGAYNIYENELLHKMIVNKLDIIKNNVEEIRHTQYMLYTILKDTNDLLNDISLKLDFGNKKVLEISKDVTIIKWFKEIEFVEKNKNSLIEDVIKELII